MDAFNGLGYMAQAFIPGATSIQRLIEGKPKEAVEELQDWIPGNAAYQNWLHDRPQDWERNVIDALIMGKPILKGAKKAAEIVERIPKGSKEGFITLTKPTGQNKLKDVIEASNEAGQKITPEIEKEIRDHIALTNAASKNPSKKNITQQNNHYDKMSTEAKQVIDAYLGQQQPHSFKPVGFDSWPAIDRKNYLEEQFRNIGVTPEDALKKSHTLKDQNYAGKYDYGVIYPDAISLDDYAKAIWDIENEPKPISITQVMGESYNKGTPLPNGARKNKREQANYDHSRQFMDTEFKQVPAIDRSGAKYTDRNDTKFDIFETWKNAPKAPRGDQYPLLNRLAETNAIEDLDKLRKWYGNAPKTSVVMMDPYYNAGVIGDKNVKLWEHINQMRQRGKSDEEIRKSLKPLLDRYQGDIDRYKARMETPVEFIYDHAATIPFRRTPSERAAAYNALGIDTPEYKTLEDMRDFYDGLTKRVFDYESKFPQSPKLSNEQLVRLKDMGVKPEEIDIFLAEHPEFMLQ